MGFCVEGRAPSPGSNTPLTRIYANSSPLASHRHSTASPIFCKETFLRATWTAGGPPCFPPFRRVMPTLEAASSGSETPCNPVGGTQETLLLSGAKSSLLLCRKPDVCFCANYFILLECPLNLTSVGSFPVCSVFHPRKKRPRCRLHRVCTFGRLNLKQSPYFAFDL